MPMNMAELLPREPEVTESAQQYGGMRFVDAFGGVFAAAIAMRDRIHGELWKEDEVQALERVALDQSEAPGTAA